METDNCSAINNLKSEINLQLSISADTLSLNTNDFENIDKNGVRNCKTQLHHFYHIKKKSACTHIIT